jgi:transposase InsO family protein
MSGGMRGGRLCGKLGMSQQNYYKARREVDSRLIGQLARAARAVQLRLGRRKLLHMLSPKLVEAGVRLGRDRFFAVLPGKGLLLDRLPSIPRTKTRGKPAYVSQSGQGDVRTDEGFLYLSLLMAMWSRKIVGYHAGDTLESEGAIRALDMGNSRRGRSPYIMQTVAVSIARIGISQASPPGACGQHDRGNALLRKCSCRTA